MRTVHGLWIATLLLPSLAMAEPTAPLKLGAVVATPSPAPLRHEVVADDRTNSDRRVIEVSIDRRASEADLVRIAVRVLKGPVTGSARAFVNFHIGAARLRDAPWASVRVSADREPQVQLLGLSADEETRLIAEARADKRSLIGAWLTASPLSPGRLTLYRDGSKAFAEWRLRSGARTTTELAESRLPRGRRYDDKAGSDEHFVVTPAGDLEVRTAKDLLAVGERIALIQPGAEVPLPAPALATLKPRAPRAVASPRDQGTAGRAVSSIFGNER
jgi:hypothetical protein